MSSNAEDLREMSEQLAETSENVRLEMKWGRQSLWAQTTVKNQILENVTRIHLLGTVDEARKGNQSAENQEKDKTELASFGNLSFIFKNSELPINLGRKAFNSCVLMVMVYGLETTAITSKTADALSVLQRAMLGISLKDRIQNEESAN